MAAKISINYSTLPSGTELETPTGIGRFIAYKKGNFKKQNVQVEDAHGKLKWYTEEALKVATLNKKQDTYASKKVANNELIAEALYYAF